MTERITLESLLEQRRETDDCPWEHLEKLIKEISLDMIHEDLFSILADYSDLLDSEISFKKHYTQAYQSMMTGNTVTGGIQQKLDYHELLFFHKATNFIDKMTVHCHKAIIMQLMFIDEITNEKNNKLPKIKDTGQAVNTATKSGEKQLSEAANKIKTLIDDAMYYEEQEIRELANTLEDVLALVEKIVRQYYGKDPGGSIDTVHNKIAPVNTVISSEFDRLAIFTANNMANESGIPAGAKNNQELKLFIKYLYSNEQRFIEQTKSTEKELYTIHAVLMSLKHHFIIAKVPAFRNIEIKVRLSIFEALTQSRQKTYWLMVQKFSLAKLLGKIHTGIRYSNTNKA